MPAQISVPASPGNYNTGGILPVAFPWRDRPKEGDKAIPININWGGSEVVNGATLIRLDVQHDVFSVIRAMYVDNLQNGADVTIIFPDTQFEVTVPAGCVDLFPIISKGVAPFYVVSTNALSSDKTFMQVLNHYPFPLSVVKSVFNSVATINGVNANASSTTALVAAGINGTITDAEIQVTGLSGGDATSSVNVVLQDGNAVALLRSALNGTPASTIVAQRLTYSTGVNLRFANGLNLVVTKAGTAYGTGAFIANVHYRQP